MKDIKLYQLVATQPHTPRVLKQIRQFPGVTRVYLGQFRLIRKMNQKQQSIYVIKKYFIGDALYIKQLLYSPCLKYNIQDEMVIAEICIYMIFSSKMLKLEEHKLSHFLKISKKCLEFLKRN